VLATLGTISVFSAAVEVLVRCDLYPEPASIINLFFIAANSLIKHSSCFSLPSFCALRAPASSGVFSRSLYLSVALLRWLVYSCVLGRILTLWMLSLLFAGPS
jgi:hypothetical protein